MIGAPPKPATTDFLDTLEKARRLTGLQVNTLTMAVVDVDDIVGWSRLTELGTSSTVTAQTTATTATTDLLNATLQAVDMVGDIANLPGITPGRLASGRDVRGMFAATQSVVRNRVAGGATFPEALSASAHYLTGVASSEPHRIGRDGQMNTGLADSRFDRFRRVAEAGACDWCRMLATRGAVYLTEQSAGKGRAYHLPRDRCHVELVANAKDIADSKALSGDWRNAIRDPQRTVDAGAMRAPVVEVPQSAAEVAQAAVAAATEAEPELTALTSGLAERFGGRMDGLEFRLKTTDSLTRKIDGDVAEAAAKGTPLTPAEVGAKMFDVNRYTTVFPEADYSSAAQASLDAMRADGYTMKVKNYWNVETNPYQGINVQLTSPTGQQFELQFHTERSLEIKMGELHEIYELARVTPKTEVAKLAEYDRLSYAAAAKIPIPGDVAGVS